MHQSSVRVAARPSAGRWMLIGAAAATLALAWSSAAMAQQAGQSEQLESARTVQLAQTSEAAVGTLGTAPVVTMDATPVGPVLSTAAVRYVPSASRNLDAPAVERMQRGPNLGRNVALVVVGVAAMIIGSDVGDTAGTLLVAGGAGTALYGLYYILK